MIYKPFHAQLRHPRLQVGISDVAGAQTAWEVHLLSFAMALQSIAEAQRRRYPEQVVSFPPETRSFPINKVAFGFQLLFLRHADVSVLIPELARFPATAFPARVIPGGRADHVLIIDGWTGGSAGLLSLTPHVQVQLEGELKEMDHQAWVVLKELGVVLDAALRIRDIRGHLRAQLDREGWTGVDGLRKATGSYRERPRAPRDQADAGEGSDTERGDRN